VQEIGPLTIAARSRDQAEYVIRSRAEQRGVRVHKVDVTDAGHDVWSVTVLVDDGDAAKLAAAALDQDTQVMHFRNHPPRHDHRAD